MDFVAFIANRVVKILGRKKSIEGTGFWVLPDGYCLTCYHVIADQKSPISIEYNSITFQADYCPELSNPGKDIAVLKVTDDKLPSVPIVPLGQPQMNAEVELYGFRKGFLNGYTVNGILRRGQDLDKIGRVYNLTATHLPDGSSIQGASGSPVYDIRRKVIVGILYGEEEKGPNTSYVHSLNKIYETWPELQEKNKAAISMGIAELDGTTDMHLFEAYLSEIISQDITTSIRILLDEFGVTQNIVSQLNSHWDQQQLSRTFILAFRRSIDLLLPSTIHVLSNATKEHSHYVWDDAIAKLKGNIPQIFGWRVDNTGSNTVPSSQLLIDIFSTAISSIVNENLEQSECNRIAITSLIEMGKSFLDELPTQSDEVPQRHSMVEKITACLAALNTDLERHSKRMQDDLANQSQELRSLRYRLNAFRPLDDTWINETLASEQNYKFYSGYRATWSDIVRGLDIPRNQLPIVYNSLKKIRGQRSTIVILSPMGGGKTTFVRYMSIKVRQKSEINETLNKIPISRQKVGRIRSESEGKTTRSGYDKWAPSRARSVLATARDDGKGESLASPGPIVARQPMNQPIR